MNDSQPSKPETSQALQEKPAATALSHPQTGSRQNSHAHPTQNKLARSWSAISKRQWVVFCVVVISLLLTGVVTYFTQPAYRASTMLEINSVIASSEADGKTTTEQPREIKPELTSIQILKSKHLAEAVVEQLEPATRKNLSQLKKTDMPAVLHDLIYGSANSVPAGDADTDLVDALLASLSIEQIQDSNLIRLTAESTDPVLAASIANITAEKFIEINIRRQFETNAKTRRYYQDRIEEARSQFQEAEKRLVEFANLNNIIMIDGNPVKSDIHQKINQYTNQLTRTRQTLARSEVLLNQIKSASANLNSMYAENPEIQRLQQEKSTLEAEYQEKLIDFKPKHPTMLALSERIAALDSQLKTEQLAIADVIRKNFNAAKKQAAVLSENLDHARTEAAQSQMMLLEYSALKHQVDLNRTFYESLLNQFQTLATETNFNTSNVNVLDRAEVPDTQFKPDLMKNALLGLLSGLIGGVILALLLQYRDKTFRKPDEVETTLDIPLIGATPESKPLKATGIVDLTLTQPENPLVQAYRSIQTALQFSSTHGLPKLICITSAENTEAKTTSAVALAIHFAQAGNRVLLLDTNLKHPALHKAFGRDNQAGLTNVLAGGESPANVTLETPVANLYYIPSGPSPIKPAELLSSEKMQEILEMAREKFDCIIMDAASLKGPEDAPVTAKMADAVILTIRAGTTRRKAVNSALQELEKSGITPLGCVMVRSTRTTKPRHAVWSFHSGNDRLLLEKI